MLRSHIQPLESRIGPAQTRLDELGQVCEARMAWEWPTLSVRDIAWRTRIDVVTNSATRIGTEARGGQTIRKLERLLTILFHPNVVAASE